MAKQKKREFSEAELDAVVDLILSGGTYEDVAKKLGFKNYGALKRYLKTDPDLDLRIKDARFDSCDALEDQLLMLADKYNKEYARVKMEAISKLLQYRNPQKYSHKVDLNVNQNISIKANLDKATERLYHSVRDVQPELDAAVKLIKNPEVTPGED
jgi:hypothetical protein